MGTKTTESGDREGSVSYVKVFPALDVLGKVAAGTLAGALVGNFAGDGVHRNWITEGFADAGLTCCALALACEVTKSVFGREVLMTTQEHADIIVRDFTAAMTSAQKPADSERAKGFPTDGGRVIDKSDLKSAPERKRLGSAPRVFTTELVVSGFVLAGAAATLEFLTDTLVHGHNLPSGRIRYVHDWFGYASSTCNVLSVAFSIWSTCTGQEVLLTKREQASRIVKGLGPEETSEQSPNDPEHRQGPGGRAR